MKRDPHSNDKRAQSLPVFKAADFCVSDGVNLGDGLSFATEVLLDDTYSLDAGARTHRLSVVAEDAGHFTIVVGTEVGTPGAALYLDSCITMMSPDGQTNEILVLVEVDDDGHVAEIFAMPLAPILRKMPYSVVGVSRDAAKRKFAQVACVSFSRGTRITEPSGALVKIEDLRAGDKVMTRDAGPQQIRWIGRTTVRATGDFAPIVITAGALNNEHDLVVSPDHRLFIYQREDRIGAGRAEVLVKARHLVDGDRIYVQEGGFVDYFQLLFDKHHIIYAEGIAAETLLIDTRTSAVLPPDVSAQLTGPAKGHGQMRHQQFELHEKLLDRPDTAELLRRASGSK